MMLFLGTSHRHLGGSSREEKTQVGVGDMELFPETHVVFGRLPLRSRGHHAHLNGVIGEFFPVN